MKSSDGEECDCNENSTNKKWKDDLIFMSLLFSSIAEPRVLPVAIAYWAWNYKIKNLI